MQVKELIKLLKGFGNANLLINDLPVSFEAYQDHTGQFVVNIKFSEEVQKTLDKIKKTQYNKSVKKRKKNN